MNLVVADTGLKKFGNFKSRKVNNLPDVSVRSKLGHPSSDHGLNLQNKMFKHGSSFLNSENKLIEHIEFYFHNFNYSLK